MKCAPVFQNQIDSLTKFGFLIEQTASGSNVERSNGYDRFVLVHTFCGKQIRWHLILDQHSPHVAPDFIFDEDFVTTPVTSLEKWDPSLIDSLLIIILELRQLYKERQKQFVKNFSDERIRFEYGTVEQWKDADFLAVQTKEVVFSLPLDDISISDLPVQNEAKPILCVKYFTEAGKLPESSITYPQNWLSLDLKIELPKWTREMCLVEYTGLVKDTLKKQVLALQQRRQFITELINVMGPATEVDTKTYANVSIVCEVSGYPMVVIVRLGNKFPQDPPTVLFQSFIQMARNRPHVREWPDCPWSPRWTAQEMAKRIKTFISEGLPIFKKQCSMLQ